VPDLTGGASPVHKAVVQVMTEHKGSEPIQYSGLSVIAGLAFYGTAVTAAAAVGFVSPRLTMAPSATGRVAAPQRRRARR